MKRYFAVSAAVVGGLLLAKFGFNSENRPLPVLELTDTKFIGEDGTIRNVKMIDYLRPERSDAGQFTGKNRLILSGECNGQRMFLVFEGTTEK